VWNDSAANARKDNWFRPSDVTIGPDGALYVADWYDPVVGGHLAKDTKGYGKIYRITPKNKKLLTPEIDITTVEGQLEAFKSPAINVRNAGFEKLKAAGEVSIAIVKPLLSNSNPYLKARAIWLLAQLGGKGKAEAELILNDKDELYRATAYRALRQTGADIIPYAQKMVGDHSAFVRREVAASLRDLPYEKTKPILLELIKKYDGEDRWYLETLGSALQGHESDIYPEIQKLFAEGKPAPQWNRQMSDFAWRLHPAAAVNDLILRGNNVSLAAEEREAAITALGFINDKAAVQGMVTLSKSDLKDVAEKAAYWLSFRQSNDWFALLDWSKLNINTAYQRKLAAMKVKKERILDVRQSIPERRRAVQDMAKDSLGAQMLIGMAAEKKLPPDLVPFIEEKIYQNPDATIRMQASDYFKRPGSDQIYSIPNILKRTANTSNGKQVFSSRCATCHKVGSEGATIGPDLTTIGKKFENEELLDAIVNPSAAIVFGYEAWLVNTKDGESLYGFLISQNQQSIVLKDIAGQKHTIAIAKISSRQKQEKSLMPDPASNGLSEQDLADIVAYLKSGGK
jgi:putative heme-binding domain-containing protein